MKDFFQLKQFLIQKTDEEKEQDKKDIQNAVRETTKHRREASRKGLLKRWRNK